MAAVQEPKPVKTLCSSAMRPFRPRALLLWTRSPGAHVPAILGCGVWPYAIGIGIPYRAIQQFGDFLMFVAFDFVQKEDSPIAVRQFLDGPGECNAVHGTCQTIIAASVFAAYLGILIVRLVQRDLPQNFLRKCIRTVFTAIRYSQVETQNHPETWRVCETLAGMHPVSDLRLPRRYWSFAGKPNRFWLCGYGTGKRTHRHLPLARVSRVQDPNRIERWCRWSLESPFESPVCLALSRGLVFPITVPRVELSDSKVYPVRSVSIG